MGLISSIQSRISNVFSNPKAFILATIFHVPESYSQCGEDLAINNFLKGKSGGFYVDVGTNDPVVNSNTYLFYRKGWTGINVEPNPRLARKISRVRPNDVTLNFGCDEQPGILKFYETHPSGLSTFSQEIAADNEKHGHKIKSVYEVKVLTLAEIFSQHVKNKEIDFLSVDTEGFDIKVLKGNDWEKFRPKLVILETLAYKSDGSGKRLGEVYDPFMLGLGYEKIFDNCLNTIYIEHNYLKTL